MNLAHSGKKAVGLAEGKGQTCTRLTVASVTNNNFGYTDAQSQQNVQRKLKKIVTNWYFHSQNYDYSNHNIANSEKKA